MGVNVVSLHSEQTGVECKPSVRLKAIQAAFNVTMSEHEHEWTHDEQVAMATYCLWAHQRLCAIDQCVNGTLRHAEAAAARGDG